MALCFRPVFGIVSGGVLKASINVCVFKFSHKKNYLWIESWCRKQGAENRAALCKPQSSRLTKLQNVTFSFSRATTLCNVIKKLSLDVHLQYLIENLGQR